MPVVDFHGEELDIPDETPDEAIKLYLLKKEMEYKARSGMPKTILPTNVTSDERPVLGERGDMNAKGYFDTPQGQMLMHYVKPLAVGGVAAATAGLGGAGPIAASLIGASSTGMDPASPHFMPSMALNAAGGKAFDLLNRAGSLRPFLNAALGGAEVGGTQYVGNKLAEATGKQDDIQSPVTASILGAGSTLIPGMASRAINAFNQAAPQVRAKLLPIIERLRQASGRPANTPPPTAAPTTPVDLSPMNTEQITQEAATLAPQAPKNGLPPDPHQYFVDRGMLPRYPTAPLAPPVDDLAAQLEASLKARGKTPPPSAPSTTPAQPPAIEPAIAPAAPPTSAVPERDLYREIDEKIADLQTRSNPLRTNSDVMGTVAEMKSKGVENYIDSLLTDDGLQELPKRIAHLDQAFPDGQVRDALRAKIITKIMDGVGESGAFGDLSTIQKLKTFGGQQFDGKKGSQVINDIFGPQGMHHLNNLYDAAESTIEQHVSTMAPTSHNWKVFATNLKNIVVGIPLLGGTAYLGSHDPGKAIAMAGTMAAGYGGYKLITVTPDALGKWVGRSRSNWSDMIKDLVEGSQKYTPAQINALISSLRKIGTEEDQQTQ